MTQIGVGVEKKGADDNAHLIINSPYVVQPHLQQKKKPSTLLLVIALILTLCVVITSVLGIVWLVRTHIWLTNFDPTPTTDPTPFGAAGYENVRVQDVGAQNAITFDEIWSLSPKGFSAQWMDNEQLLYRVNGTEDLILHNVADNSIDTLVEKAVFEDNGIINYYPTNDTRYILMSSDHQKVWRHSFSARYMIYDTDSNTMINFPNDDITTERIQYAAFAPAGYGLIFVHANNLYYQDGPEGNVIQITNNGDLLYMFNGIPDWLYEEDVLGSRSASYFSPSGEFLIFGRFNDQEVPLVQYPLYLPNSEAYATQYQAAYPTAGNVDGDAAGPNTVATLHLVDLTQTNNFAIADITPPSPPFNETDHYFTRVAMVDNKTAAITWTNRIQNEAYVQIIEFESNGDEAPTIVNDTVNLIHTVENGWIDAPWPAPIPDLESEDSPAYFTYYMDVSTNGSYKHVARVTIPESGLGTTTFLTAGQHEVQGVLAMDDERGYLYFYSNNGVQRQRHLMRLEFSENEGPVQNCITCDMEDCTYVSAQISTLGEYFLLSCLGPDIPHYEVMRHNLTLVRVMEDNSEFRQVMDTKDKPTRIDRELQLGVDNVARAAIFNPPNMQSGAWYPLLVYVYGGPGSLQVTDRYEYGSTTNNWLRYLGSEHNIVVALVDARGTIGRGEDWKFQMYKGMADLEIEDQIAAGRMLINELDYVDPNENAAIFGWSYGGFAASHILGQSDTSFGCALAVAPVTSMRYYDTAYTERFMGLATPSDNQDGYARTDLFDLAENFTDKNYFLAHGTHDDNVHFRHFSTFAHSLTEAGVHFTQKVYVDEDHSINTPAQSRHLFQSMTDFLHNECYDAGYRPPTQAPTVPTTTQAGSIARPSAMAMLTMALLVLISALY